MKYARARRASILSIAILVAGVPSAAPQVQAAPTVGGTLTESGCAPGGEHARALKELWSNLRGGLEASLAQVGLGSGTALYNAQIYTQNLLEYAIACNDLELLDELADYLLVAFDHLHDVGTHQTWVADPDTDEALPVLHVSQFLYEVAVAVGAIAELPDDQRTAAMRELTAIAPLVLEDHYRRWILEEPVWSVYGYGCKGGAPLRPHGGLSLGAWVRTTDANGWIVGIRSTTVVVEVEGGRPAVRLITDHDGDPGMGPDYTIFELSGATPIHDGSWHHVMLVFRPRAGVAELYVDGVLDGATATLGDVRSVGSRLYLGGYKWTDDVQDQCCFLAGSIDDARLYRCGLGPADVAALAVGGEPGCDAADLVGHWDLESGGLDAAGPHDLVVLPAGAPVPSDEGGPHAFLGTCYDFDGVDDYAATYDWDGAHTHEWFLRGKAWGTLQDGPADPPYCHAIFDVDLWVATGLTELLASYRNDPRLGPWDPARLAALEAYLSFAVDLLESRTVETQLTDWQSLPRPGIDVDPGAWDLHPGRAYSGHRTTDWLGGTCPDLPEESVAPGTGWDISHARRFVNVFDTFHDHRDVTRRAFPDRGVMERLANQYAYGVFEGDLTLPLFANYFDGSPGWYRVEYHGPGFGYGPGDLSEAAYTGGFGFWKTYNPDVAVLNDALWSLVTATDRAAVLHRETRIGVRWHGCQRVGELDIDLKSSLDMLMFLPVMAVDP